MEYKIDSIAAFNKLALSPGDSVLFKRGVVYHGGIELTPGSKDMPITYDAYGEGVAPIFTCSVNLTDVSFWNEVEPNIWCAICQEFGEVGNIIFNDNSYGTLAWSKDDLKSQGAFYDNAFGIVNQNKPLPKEHKLYIYSIKNPAVLYQNIECATSDFLRLMKPCDNIVINNITFKNTAHHAIATDLPCHNVTVSNCTFKNIGGAVYSTDLKIRFGNAVEFWNVAENIVVENCEFDNIYDSAVTHQGAHDICSPALGFIIKNNTFKKCGMAAYEQRDRMPIASEFINNICEQAGEGFSSLGEQMPRNSEIYPEPMGHHIFLWRIDAPTDGGSLEISGNTFKGAIYGAAIYERISDTAKPQLNLHDNNFEGPFLVK